jgi:hypothetical protein
MYRRKKKQARKNYGSYGIPGSTSSSIDVAETWMRERKEEWCRSWW